MTSLPEPPQINGVKMTLVQTTRAELALAGSPLLPALVRTINKSFAAAYEQPVMPSDVVRLQTDDELIQELSPDVLAFLVAPADDPTAVLASVFVQPFYPPDEPLPHHHAVWIPQPKLDVPGEAIWTIRLLCVSPHAQRNGIAGWLLALAEYIIQREVRASGNFTSIRLVISTVKEANEAFYAKRGWKLVDQRRMEPGFLNSEGGFTIIDLDKVLAV